MHDDMAVRIVGSGVDSVVISSSPSSDCVSSFYSDKDACSATSDYSRTNSSNATSPCSGDDVSICSADFDLDADLFDAVDLSQLAVQCKTSSASLASFFDADMTCSVFNFIKNFVG